LKINTYLYTNVYQKSSGERTIMTSRPNAVRAVITVRHQVMKHVSDVT